MKAYIEAYGCTSNIGESWEIEDQLVGNGWELEHEIVMKEELRLGSYNRVRVTGATRTYLTGERID